MIAKVAPDRYNAYLFCSVQAAVVKLVYTLVSGTSERKLVEVQVLSAAPFIYLSVLCESSNYEHY